MHRLTEKRARVMAIQIAVEALNSAATKEAEAHKRCSAGSSCDEAYIHQINYQIYKQKVEELLK